ncbi:MAG: hypothetical protein ACM3Q1_01205 [Bacteroidales bacterium]
MNIDIDPSIEDMIRASYRLSWPGPAPRRPRAMRRLLGRVATLCRRQPLLGWPVELSRPAA